LLYLIHNFNIFSQVEGALLNSSCDQNRIPSGAVGYGISAIAGIARAKETPARGVHARASIFAI